MRVEWSPIAHPASLPAPAAPPASWVLATPPPGPLTAVPAGVLRSGPVPGAGVCWPTLIDVTSLLISVSKWELKTG